MCLSLWGLVSVSVWGRTEILQGSDAWGVVRWFQSLGWVWLEWVVGLFFWLAIVVEIVVTLSFEKFANEK